MTNTTLSSFNQRSPVIHGILWKNRRTRLERRAVTALASLVASPHDLATPLVMPAGARLAVSHSVGLTADTTTVSLGNGATFTTPTLAADEQFRGVWAEEGQSISVAGVPTGTLSLFYLDPFDASRARLIGTRTIA